MIVSTRGDMLSSTRHGILVNPVNCVGVMGKGLALQFKQHYPEIMPLYQLACRDRVLTPGGILPLRTRSGLWVVNFATKDHWKDSSRYNWVHDGLIALSEWLVSDGRLFDLSVAIPPLGCGLGGLNWASVKVMILERLEGVPQDIYLYEGGK